MNIRYISDIHLEHMNATQVKQFIASFQPNNEDLLVLSGDIGNPYAPSYRALLEHCAANFPKTFLIAGNHEFYSHGHTIEETIKQIQTVCASYPTITFLHNSSEVYKGIRFIGTILWSKVTNPAFTINDTEVIRGMTVQRYQALHKECLAYLTQALATNQPEPVIVITHHMPSYSLIHPMYTTPSMQPYNQWFATNLDELIQTHQTRIQGWFYGHTHTASQMTLHGVPMLCNPKGYPRESNHNQHNSLHQTFIIESS
jgi:predicted phosphodiesterase